MTRRAVPRLPRLLLVAALVGTGALLSVAAAQERPETGPKLRGTPSEFSGMVQIPAGEFKMGVDEKWFEKTFNMKSKRKCHPSLKGKEKDLWWPVLQVETPEHDAVTEAYAIDRFEVTNAQYKVFLEETSQRSVFTTLKMKTLAAVAAMVHGQNPADWTVATIYYLNVEKLVGMKQQVLEANKALVEALLGRFNVKSFDELPEEKQVEAWATFELPESTALRVYTRHVPRSWEKARMSDEIAALPVGDVSGEEADDFAEWAGKHVPTEEEWEKAARGPEGHVYPWGDEWDPSDKKQKNWIYWQGTTSPPAPPYKDRPMAVDSLPEGQSGYGCFHMLGNLMEWTSSFPKKYPRSDAKHENFGVERGRVLRGLAWGDGKPFKDMELLFRNTSRVIDGPGGHPIYASFRYSGIGFRCAKYATPVRDVLAYRLGKLRAKGLPMTDLDFQPSRAFGVELPDYSPPGEEGKGKVFVRSRTKVVGVIPLERLDYPTPKAILEAAGEKRKPEDPPVILAYVYWNSDLKVDVAELVKVKVEQPAPEDGAGEEGKPEEGEGKPEEGAEEKPAEEQPEEGGEEKPEEGEEEKPEGGEGEQPAPPVPGPKPPVMRTEERRAFVPGPADGLFLGIDRGRLALYAPRIKGPEVVAYLPDYRADPTQPLVVLGTSKPSNGSQDGPPLIRRSATIDRGTGTVRIQLALGTRSKSSPVVFGVALELKLKGKLDGTWRETKPE